MNTDPTDIVLHLPYVTRQPGELILTFNDQCQISYGQRYVLFKALITNNYSFLKISFRIF